MNFKLNKIFIYLFIFLLIVILTGIFFGFFINIIRNEFSFRLMRVSIINSFFLGFGLLLNLFLFNFLSKNLKIIMALILSFLIILGISILGFLIVFITDPFYLFYDRNVVYAYLLLNFDFILILSIILTGFAIFRNQLTKKELQLEEEKFYRKEAEYQSLVSKVNPHFLFNSFNLIISLLDDKKKSEESLIILSEILRYQLDSGEKKVIPLKDELEVIKKYLYIQKLRFGERIQYFIKGSSDIMIPPFILQPLIENSIKHNINKVINLIITIVIQELKNEVLIIVEDSELLLKSEMVGLGQGLINTKKRVELSGGTMNIINGGVQIQWKKT